MSQCTGSASPQEAGEGTSKRQAKRKRPEHFSQGKERIMALVHIVLDALCIGVLLAGVGAGTRSISANYRTLVRGQRRVSCYSWMALLAWMLLLASSFLLLWAIGNRPARAALIDPLSVSLPLLLLQQAFSWFLFGGIALGLRLWGHREPVSPAITARTPLRARRWLTRAGGRGKK